MKFILKPVFIGWSTFITQLPIHLFFTVWLSMFLGGISQIFISKFVTFTVEPFILIGCLTFIIFPLVVLFVKKFNYEKTEYKFFDDRLEFEEGFFTIHKKVIKFQDIKEVTLRKGMLQRVNGLGTIYLATLATGTLPFMNPFAALGFGNTSASGISVKDIIEPDKEYERIRQLIETQRK